MDGDTDYYIEGDDILDGDLNLLSCMWLLTILGDGLFLSKRSDGSLMFDLIYGTGDGD